MQIPDSVRLKFESVSSNVKTSILNSNPPSSSRKPRKQKSTSTMPEIINVSGDQFTIVASPPMSPSSTRARPISLGLFKPKGLGINMTEQPSSFISWLSSHKATDLLMQVERCKKLRMCLRHESTIWVSEFLNLGGYDLVLARLQDLLDVEWR